MEFSLKPIMASIDEKQQRIYKDAEISFSLIEEIKQFNLSNSEPFNETYSTLKRAAKAIAQAIPCMPPNSQYRKEVNSYLSQVVKDLLFEDSLKPRSWAFI